MTTTIGALLILAGLGCFLAFNLLGSTLDAQGFLHGGVSPNRRKFRHAKSRAQRVPPPTWISGSVLLTKVSRM